MKKMSQMPSDFFYLVGKVVKIAVEVLNYRPDLKKLKIAPPDIP